MRVSCTAILPIQVISRRTHARSAAWLALRCLAFALAGSLASCALISSEPKFVTLEGKVTTQNPVPLSSDATLVVELVDSTRGDSLPDVLAKQRIDRPAQWPISFSLIYDQRAMLKGHRYEVSATLYAGPDVVFGTPGGKVEFREALPPGMEIMLERVSPPKRNSTP